jgi:hypothetical protein
MYDTGDFRCPRSRLRMSCIQRHPRLHRIRRHAGRLRRSNLPRFILSL